MRSRIREIRKAKGLRLSEVAARIEPQPSTAQTIGRLETGQRRLSVEWLNKIAQALGVDPAELLTVPAPPDCPMVAGIGEGGVVATTLAERVDLRLAARDPVAIAITAPWGDWRPGDRLICDRVAGDQAATLHGHDALVETLAEGLLFGRLIVEPDASITLAGQDGEVRRGLRPLWAARPTMLLRGL